MESVVASHLSVQSTHFMWLEITSNCQLECSHCYAESGPGRGHGAVSVAQWLRVLDEAASAGVQQVQFIGGEPTSHPALPRLVNHALEVGLRVEVFSNLVAVREPVWRALANPGVVVATSYYSAGADTHDRITRRAGSFGRTRANIVEAIQRGIALRVGLIRFSADQDIEAAIDELVEIGVSPDAIRVDDQRGVGRGSDSAGRTTEDELCGNCASGVLAVMPDGSVRPCVFSRAEQFNVGNIVTDSLASVLNGEQLQRMRDDLTSVFVQRGLVGVDHEGRVRACGPACSPSCVPVGNCNPVVNPGPCNPQAGHPPRPEPPVRPPGPVCNPY